MLKWLIFVVILIGGSMLLYWLVTAPKKITLQQPLIPRTAFSFVTNLEIPPYLIQTLGDS